MPDQVFLNGRISTWVLMRPDPDDRLAFDGGRLAMYHPEDGSEPGIAAWISRDRCIEVQEKLLLAADRFYERVPIPLGILADLASELGVMLYVEHVGRLATIEGRLIVTGTD